MVFYEDKIVQMLGNQLNAEIKKRIDKFLKNVEN